VVGTTCAVGADWIRRRDASLLPRIARVDNPYAMPEPSIDATPGSPGNPTLRKPAMPSEEWRSVVEERFKNLKRVRFSAINLKKVLPIHSTLEYGPTYDQRSSSPSAKYDS